MVSELQGGGSGGGSLALPASGRCRYDRLRKFCSGEASRKPLMTGIGRVVTIFIAPLCRVPELLVPAGIVTGYVQIRVVIYELIRLQDLCYATCCRA